MSQPTYADVSSELVAVCAELEALAYGFRKVHDSEDDIALGCAEILAHVRKRVWEQLCNVEMLERAAKK